jgi:hypothetical protein
MDELLKNIDMGALRKMNDASEAASRQRSNPKAPIREQVTARLALAYSGTAMQAFTKALQGPGFQSAPLLTPPTANGMTETIQKLHDIVMKHQAPSEAEYKQACRSGHLCSVTRICNLKYLPDRCQIC